MWRLNKQTFEAAPGRPARDVYVGRTIRQPSPASLHLLLVPIAQQGLRYLRYRVGGAVDSWNRLP